MSEFYKSTPWRFVDECKLDFSSDFLREIFKKEKYSNEPTEPGFSTKINLDPKYAASLRPHVTFEFELDKYDYWVIKRAENEPREIGVDGEEFIG